MNSEIDYNTAHLTADGEWSDSWLNADQIQTDIGLNCGIALLCLVITVPNMQKKLCINITFQSQHTWSYHLAATILTKYLKQTKLLPPDALLTPTAVHVLHNSECGLSLLRVVWWR